MVDLSDYQFEPVTGLSPSFNAATNTAALNAILTTYAADPDSATNYLTATAGGYELRLDVGVYELDASALLPMGPGLTIRGKGPLQTTLRYTEDGAPLTIAGSRSSSSHHTGGGLEDLTLDGGNVAKTLVEVRFSDKVRLSNVILTDSAAGTADEHGALAIMGGQNGDYDHLLITNSSGTAQLMNYGASGNTFKNMHMTDNYEDVRLSGTHAAMGTTVPCQTNHWINPIMERDNLAHTKQWSIYIGAGKHNLFDHPIMTLAADSANVDVARTVAIVKIERQLASDGVSYYSNSLNIFRDPLFGGSGNQYAADLTGSGGYGPNHSKWTRAFDVAGVVALGLNQTRVFIQGGRCVLDGIAEFWHDSTGATGYVVPHIDAYIDWDETGGVAGTERVVGTGIATDDLRKKARTPIEVRAAKTDGTSVAFEARNNSNAVKLQITDDGALSGAKATAKAANTDGSSVAIEAQNSSAAVKLQVFDDGAVQVGGTGGPKRLFGSGAPASTPADGSTFQRTDSAAGQPNHYVRQNGAWVASGRPAVIQVPAGAFMNTSGTTATSDTAGRTGLWRLPDVTTTHDGAYVYLPAWAAGYSVDLVWMPIDGTTTSVSWSCDMRLERIAIPAAPGSTSIFNTTISTDTMTVGQWQVTNMAAAYVPSAAGHFNLRVLRTGSDSFNGGIGLIAVVFTPN